MKLNVLLITYNQENYIEQCLDSILMQETHFAFNILVADDCSTDSTLSIIERYAASSSIEFKFLKNTSNLGFVKNYKRGFESCDAEYVAVMEGDDYWTDPLRLQKHVDFLHSHRECVMSFNRIINFYESNSDFVIREWNLKDDFEYITTRQLTTGNKIGNLSACVFRNNILKKLKPDLFDMPQVADWLLSMVIGQYGFIAQLKEPTSVYRIHARGIWSGQNEKEQINDVLNCIDANNKYLEYKYNDDFIRYKNYLIRTSTPQKKGLSSYLPPIFVSLVKALIPPFLYNK